VATTAVAVESVSKRFRLYHEKYMTLKERVIHMGNLPYEEFWALTDVSLEIAESQTVGLIGHNGSGKSTLLKCIGGILRPTSGQIRVRGQVAAMLELGAGFSHELSGRDNIYLNATLLGMPRREIDRRFDEIVAFSELEQFIDNQVKFYSSGMVAKLGFAVAVSFEPDVLLVDEVLAVGDERFQLKCLDKIKQFQTDGRTIIIVSHSPDVLRAISDKIFVLEKGRLVAEGEGGEAVLEFRRRLFGTGGDEAVAGNGGAGSASAEQHGVRLGAVSLAYPGGADGSPLSPGSPLTVDVAYSALVPEEVLVSLSIWDQKGELVFRTDTDAAGHGALLANGDGGVRFDFTSVPLLDGNYNLSASIERARDHQPLDLAESVAQFSVVSAGKEAGRVSMPVRVELRVP
jgi:ABC-2 type transport system ATP-binding protein